MKQHPGDLGPKGIAITIAAGIILGLTIAIAITGCAELTARGRDPIFTALAHTGIESAAGCLVTQFDRAFNGRTHKVVIIQPGRILEVSPQQEITIAAERYFARLSASSPAATQIQIFSTLPFAGDPLIAATKACTA